MQDESGVHQLQQPQSQQQQSQQMPHPQSSMSRLSSWLHLSSVNNETSLDIQMDEMESEMDLDSDLYLTVDTKQTVDRFHRKKQEGYIDVWWLFDDGGFT